MAGMTLNKLLPAGAAVSGVPGAYFGTEISQSIAASGNYVVPVGIYYAITDANGELQYQTNTAGTWRGAGAAAADTRLVVSDGTNVRVLNTSGSVASQLYLLPVN